MMLYFLYKVGKFLSLALPINMAYGLAGVLGNVYFLLSRKDKKIITSNIEVVLNHGGNPDRNRCISQAVFVNFARYLVEFFRSRKINLGYLERNVVVKGRENLDQALGLGKGVLLLSAHLGNWELGATVLAMLGYKINAVVWTHRSRQINDFFLNLRESKGVKVIPLGLGVRRAFSALKSNELVALLGDYDYAVPESGVVVKFFGRDTAIPKGPAALSLKTGASIVPIFVLREDDNKFRIVLEKPISYMPIKNREYDLKKLTQRIAQVLEHYIARYPAHWALFRQRWPIASSNKV